MLVDPPDNLTNFLIYHADVSCQCYLIEWVMYRTGGDGGGEGGSKSPPDSRMWHRRNKELTDRMLIDTESNCSLFGSRNYIPSFRSEGVKHYANLLQNKRGRRESLGLIKINGRDWNDSNVFATTKGQK